MHVAGKVDPVEDTGGWVGGCGCGFTCHAGLACWLGAFSRQGWPLPQGTASLDATLPATFATHNPLLSPPSSTPPPTPCPRRDQLRAGAGRHHPDREAAGAAEEDQGCAALCRAAPRCPWAGAVQALLLARCLPQLPPPWAPAGKSGDEAKRNEVEAGALQRIMAALEVNKPARSVALSEEEEELGEGRWGWGWGAQACVCFGASGSRDCPGSGPLLLLLACSPAPSSPAALSRPACLQCAACTC